MSKRLGIIPLLASLFWLIAPAGSLVWLVLAWLQPPGNFAEWIALAGLMLKVVGGVLVVVGLVFTWRRIRIAEEGQVTERFTRAIEHLGSEQTDVQLGGIYALERIARDSERDHWPIMEILTSFVRWRLPWEENQRGEPPKSVTPEIQAALTAIGRRTRTFGKGETERLNLSATNLRQANLQNAHLEGANLIGAHLEGARLSHAHLDGAFLDEACLESIQLAPREHPSVQDRTKQTSLRGVTLKRAKLWSCGLAGAFLAEADLQEASLVLANLSGANLTRANLSDADLSEADLGGATLLGANVRGACLETDSLTQNQIDGTIGDAKTRLPAGLTRPQGWT